MKKIALFFLVAFLVPFLTAVILVASSSEAYASVDVVCFNDLFQRKIGQPRHEQNVFPAVKGPATVKVYNGDGSGWLHRANIANVLINGKIIFRSTDFNKKVKYLEAKVILLDGKNTVDVNLLGMPWVRIRVEVIQQVQADAAAVIGPTGGVVKVSNPSIPAKGSSITFLPNALAESTMVSISQALNIPELPSDLSPNGIALEFKPHGVVFDRFCLVSLPAKQPADDEYLAIAYYNDQMSEWKLLPIAKYDPDTGRADFIIDHFSILLPVMAKYVPDSVSIDFSVGTDSLNFDNGNQNQFKHCPEEKAGVCNGIAIYAKWFYENYGHGLRCRYDLDKAEEIACEVFKNYDTSIFHLQGAPSKLLSFFAWLGFGELAVFDFNQAAFMIDSLKKGKPTILGVWGWWGSPIPVGHALLVKGWTKTGDRSGYFTVYDVNDNKKTYQIPCSKDQLGIWTFKYSMCPEYPDLSCSIYHDPACCPDNKVFMPYVDFWLGIESIYNKYMPPDNWCPACSGLAWACGDNHYGELGDGSSTTRTTPVQVTGLTGVTAIAAGVQHSSAVKSDGTAWAWGDNSHGQLGDGSTTNRDTPVQVSGLTGVINIAAGFWHTVAVKTDGTVWAWGDNSIGQLGDGSTTNRDTPVQVSGLTGVTAVATEAWHSIALKSDGTVWAWGNNADGEVGDGSASYYKTTPVQVSGLTNVTAIAAGYYYNVALKSDGTVWGWGDNQNHQLGGWFWNTTTPVQISGMAGVTAIDAGGGHTIALKLDGTVSALGYNYYGQLGDDSTTNRDTPVQVIGLTGVITIAAGVQNSFAVKSDGTVWGWGWNYYGNLGDGSTTNRTTPVQITGLTGVTAIAAGAYHTVAVKPEN